MSNTKIYKVLGTSLEIEMMSSGITHLWDRDNRVVETYQATKESQQEMVKKIKELYPDWIEGMVKRTQ